MNSNDLTNNFPSNKKVYIYITLTWAWAWIYGYLWFTNLKNILLFDITIFFFLGPFIITLIFTLLDNLPAKKIGIINYTELKKAPNSLMLSMLLIYFLIMLVLHIYAGFFGLNLPLINDPGIIFLSAFLMFFYMLLLAFYEESAWSGWFYSFIPMKNFIKKNVVIAIAWFIWYIPYFLWFSNINLTFEKSIVFFIIFLLYLIPTRFLYSWFREKSNSLYWPCITNTITGTANFIIVNLIDILKVNDLLFFGLSAIASAIMSAILYYSFPLES
ncbi:MAG: hypothetical protein HWN67_05685 [Candidatus Helarchaeota archaeon]|nr:hypothetical protein [Candidatus Helarchaeota archaeon]